MVRPGQVPPSFRLPSGQGPEVGLEDYRGRKHLVVWFTKGMACPFCRTQMSQLARGYDRIRTLNAEVLQISPTKPDRARFYVKNFPIPFPYLCDPEYRTFADWGLDVRSHSLVWYAKTLATAVRMEKPKSDLGEPAPSLLEIPQLLHDSDMGFFILDRAGVVRYALAGTYEAGEHGTRQIPSNDEIVRELERCEGELPAAGRPA